jgi:polysaccharide transporter, PST family
LLRKFLTHRLTQNVGALALLQLVSYVTPLLVLIYLTRTLGIELYGILAFSVAVTQFSYVVLDFGFTLSATQKISVRRERKEYVSRLIGAIFAIKTVALILVAGAIVLYVMHSEKYQAHLDLFLLSLIPLASLCFLPTWFFTGIERMFYITLFTIISKFLYLILIFVTVRSANDLLWVPIADGISQLVGTATGIYLVYRVGYSIRLPRYRDIKYAARLTRGFFMSRFAATIFSGGGVVLLGLFGTPATTAIYSIAERFYQAMQQVFSPIIQAIYPYMARERNIFLLMKIAAGCLLLAILVGMVLVLAGPYLILWWFGPSWSASTVVLNVFAVNIIVSVFLSMSGYPLSSILGTMHTANVSVVYGAIFYVTFTGLLIASGNVTALAVAWALLLTELFVLAYRAVVLWPKAYQLARRHGKM